MATMKMPAGAPPVPGRSPAWPSVPGYEITEELGRGGMGVVYKARHIGLNRDVALKMILTGPHADPGMVARFRLEAEAIAHIRHPNIIQIHEIGEHNGSPYFSLEYLEGGSLSKRLNSTPQPARWCAEICEKLARAIQAAHEQGIIHRDLKPANVLFPGAPRTTSPDAAPAAPRKGGIRTSDEPKITDFGLAKRLEGEDGLTMTGVLMGTPSYMPPEQAEGRKELIGPRSDVYSLGAILYEMLTGRPPFKGATALETIQQVRQQEAIAPRRLTPTVPRDLETICLTCIEKDPSKRYATAEDLAVDLGHYLNSETIVARPSGPLEHAAKWARRKPAAAALVAVSALALAGLIGGGTWYSGRLAVERNRAVTEAGRARAAEAKARKQQQEAERQRTEATRRLAESLIAQADGLSQTGRPQESKDRYAEARSMLAELNESTFAVETGLFELHQVCPPPLHTFNVHSEPVTGVAFSPDGSQALSGCLLRLWDVKTGRQLWSFGGQTSSLFSVAFSADGRTALSGGADENTLKLWDVAARRELQTLSSTQRVWSVAFSPDGKRVLSGGMDDTLKLWNVETGSEVLSLHGHTQGVWSVAFSPDGNVALSGGGDKALRLWEIATGREMKTFLGHKDAVCSTAFSPDGKLALSGSGGLPTQFGRVSEDNTLKLWDVATGKEMRTFSGHTDPVWSVAFSPDGNRALSGSWDKTLKLWDLNTGLELGTFGGYIKGGVWSVAFSPHGDRALSGEWDFSDQGLDCPMKLWNATTSREVRTFRGHRDDVCAVAFSPDGRLALSGGGHPPSLLRNDMEDDAPLRLWDVATGRELRAFVGRIEGRVTSVAFSPDGKLVLSGSGFRMWFKSSLGGKDSGTLKLWDVATGRDLRTFGGHAEPVTHVAFSPDGELALSGSEDKTLKLWEVKTGRDLRTFSGHAEAITCVAFSPDGKLALSGSVDDTLKLWDVASGHELRALRGHTKPVSCVTFSPEGKLALSGSEDRTLKVWEVATGRELRALRGHTEKVSSVAFLPDGKIVFSGSEDKTLKLWDIASARELRTFRGHLQGVLSVALSLCGNLLLSGSADKTLQLRDFSRPARYREFDVLLPKAREALQKNENDAEALKTLGEWYAFRGVNDWGADLLERARTNGAEVSSLTLARCYLQLSDDEHKPPEKRSAHRAAAAAEFEKEIARVKAQTLPGDAKSRLAREQEDMYLGLCLQAVQKAPPVPTKP